MPYNVILGKPAQPDDETEKKLAKLKYQGTDWDRDFYRAHVYSTEQLDGYLRALKIESNEGRASMTDSLLGAAMYYEVAKRSHITSYSPPGHYIRNLKSTPKPTEQLKTKLEKISEDGLMAVSEMTFAAGKLIDAREYPEEARRFIDAFCQRSSDGVDWDWGGFVAFLDFYKTMCERALETATFNIAAHKTFPLQTWLQNLDHSWKQYSAVPFSAGKYHEGIGYNSDAVHILKAIMEPLDDSVSLQAIANKLIEINRQTRK